ncbi:MULTISPECIES: YdcH family protein [Acetobacter]|uniref:YdcH family protein n=1 Tax=Acetobacter suratthaniensis TaxID=1502841 RepID=A0ABS3LI88_9PROT|nr:MULTISPECIES: YdcH family protein [Acetobacter]MBO1327318.1 YdcH family protein [Acetobacter suratthaniensis]MCX2565069.1 YdcH family protein [Acetobacter suratthaniensis]
MLHDRDSVLGQLHELRSEHRDLDTVINRMTSETAFIDQLYLQRLKKRKLQLKDLITRLESRLIPDNIA